eukprot:1615048-Pyramimonas_sp.AAC.1
MIGMVALIVVGLAPASLVGALGVLRRGLVPIVVRGTVSSAKPQPVAQPSARRNTIRSTEHLSEPTDDLQGMRRFVVGCPLQEHRRICSLVGN